MKKTIEVYEKLQWIIVFFLYAVDVLWVVTSSFSIKFSIENFVFYYSIVGLIFALYFLYKKFRPDPKIMSVLISTCWLLSFSAAGIVLSYLAYTTNQPLVTHILATIDNDLGVYPLDIVLWFHNHGWLNILFFIFYASFFFQKSFTLIYLSFRGAFINLHRFILQYMFAAFLSIFLGALFPAEGTYAYYHFHTSEVQLEDLQRLYELRQNIVDIRQWNGIITFPSFHTAVACLYIYAFKSERKIIFLPILILNILLMFACVSNGGHFFIDVLGGIVVATIAIAIESLIYRWVTKSSLKNIQKTEKLSPLTT